MPISLPCFPQSGIYCSRVFVLVGCLVALAQAWGELGHRVVAHVAEALLTPKTKLETQRLLGAGDDLISVATWADAIRSGRRETGPWHYITLQVRGSQVTPDRADTPNVVSVLVEQIRILNTQAVMPKNLASQSPAASDHARAEALRWVVHLVADLHQPLHTGEDHDRGGNDTQVRLNRRKMGWHQVWDYGLLEKLESNEAVLARRLLDSAQFRERSHAGYLGGLNKGDIQAFGRESHGLAVQAYTRNYRGNDKAKPGAEINGRAILGRGRAVELSAEDVAWGQQVVFNQLLTAGVRLAGILNQAFDPQGVKLALPLVLPTATTRSTVVVTPSKATATQPVSLGTYSWSESSRVFHLSRCKDVTRILPKNLRTGNSPPLNKHLHRNCPAR
jgi:hypothetical protein